jgi:hypothetical protein
MKLTNKCSLFFAVFVLLAIGSPGKVRGEPLKEFKDNFDEFLRDSSNPYFCTVEKFTDPETINGLALLQKDLYTHSNLVVSRSIHDMPLFMQTNAGYRENYCLSVEVDPFYNQTTKMYFVDSSTNIKSYVDFSSTGLAGSAIIQGQGLFSQEMAQSLQTAADILPIASNMTLEERRAGLYIRLNAYLKQWTFQFAVPVYYQERNLFISNEDQQALKNNAFLSSLSTGMSEDDARTIMMKHIVSDKIGLGDMRFHALFTPYESDCTRCTLGGFVTLPTAFAFKNGLMGGSFYKHNYIPPFSLKQAFSFLCEPDVDPARDAQVKQSAINYGLRALDHLTEILCETSLGNNGHVGIAPIIECDHIFARCDDIEIGILGQASLQGFLPCNEKRAYLVQNVPSNFNTRNYEDESLAKENVAFLDSELNNILFPTIIDTKVTPGLIFETNAAFTYAYSDVVKGQLGYDFWWRGDESIAMSELVNGTYDIPVSKTAKAWQQKIFGSVETWFPFCGGDLTTRFGGDVTVASKGIGKDFTLNVLLQLVY